MAAFVSSAGVEIGDLDIADLPVQHFIRRNGRLDAAALDRNGEAFLPAQDRQRHEGPLLAAHLCARPCHAEVKRFFALDLGDDIAGEQSGLLRRAVGGHGLNSHSAEFFLRGDGHADADIGVPHLLIVAALFLGGQVIAPAVAAQRIRPSVPF